MSERMKKTLKAMFTGSRLVLDYLTNQYGEKVENRILWFENGVWREEGFNCSSSVWYGMGTCQCNSHAARYEETVSREYVLTCLREKDAFYERREREKEEEREWLEEVISGVM